MLISLQLVLASSSGIKKEGPSNYSFRFPRDAYDLLPSGTTVKLEGLLLSAAWHPGGLGACEEAIPGLMASHSPIC